jgi:tRNA threonylcarbamoyladenosine biosynthesis protein TsaE
VLVEYDAGWPERFVREAAKISEALGDIVVDVEHVGSTAVPGLVGKGTIDIAVGATTLEPSPEAIERMREIGFDDDGLDIKPNQRIFRKGGGMPRDVLVHVVKWGSPEWAGLLRFRDRLVQDETLAREYAELKRRLLEKRGSWYSGADKNELVARVLGDAPSLEFARSSSPEETEALAARLAGELRVGDVVTVSGELGSGKTTFVRGACRALGVTGPVTSPTFTIGHRYAGRVPVSHLDLYRFANVSAAEWGDLEPYFDDAVAFVEWPEAGAGVLPAPRVRVRMRHTPDHNRAITIERADPRL